LEDAKIKNFTSCFKEQKFLEFFFRNLRANNPTTPNRHIEYKYVSNCGTEKNYLKCDDLPFIATYLDQTNNTIQLNNIKSAYWSIKFEPKNLCYNIDTGRLYYFFNELKFDPLNKFDDNNSPHNSLALKKHTEHFEKLPCHVCLVKSLISINLMKSLREMDDGTFEFEYQEKTYKLGLSGQNEKYKNDLEKYSCFNRILNE